MKKAAIYLRSSKDRKDVSLDSQRRELDTLAAAKGLTITAEFSDVVESGADENRPGYQKLCTTISDKMRGWDHLLILDTSRLARRQHIAIAFSHHCQRKGIKILYAKVPELDPINEILVLSLMRAMDEMHSHTSREKGLAGMAENVRRGFRAGGRAPVGYVLVHHDTGLQRDGQQVQKSQLKPSEDAVNVQKFLKARAAGTPRAVAMRDSGVAFVASSAVGVEWNALTYSGCTVWNVHREVGSEEGRRRPRSEWLIVEDTHPALITREEAERILSALENSSHGKAVSMAKRGMSDYLLSGLLVTSGGHQWHGTALKSGPSYRLPAAAGVKGKVIPADRLERFVLRTLAQSMKNDAFVDALYTAAKSGTVDTSARKQKSAELSALTLKIDRAVEAALFLEDAAPMYRKIDALERERKSLISDIEQLKEEEDMQRAAQSISREWICEMLDELACTMVSADRQQTKHLLTTFLDQVTLDSNMQMRLHFRIGGDCVSMASPQGFDRYAVRQVIEITFAA